MRGREFEGAALFTFVVKGADFCILFFQLFPGKHGCAHVCSAFGFCMVNRQALRYYAQEGVAEEFVAAVEE